LSAAMNSKQGSRPTVSILIPAYKEEEYVQATLQGMMEAFRAAKLAAEIIVVLDAVPGDKTGTYVRDAARKYEEIRVIERQGKRGVGDAIKTGIENANGRIVIPVMGDQSETPDDIVNLTKKALDYDLVFTDRFKHGRPLGYSVLKYLANRCCNLAAMALLGIPYSDTTNAFKAYKKDLLTHIELSSKGFEIFLEMPVKAMRFARRTDVVEVTHLARKKGKPKLSLMRDGYRYVNTLFLLLKSTRR
jgi:dolichol-phosphate mannosyltransferase